MTDANTRLVQTRQGDTIDMICQRYFGLTRDVTEQVLAINPDVADHIVFTAGTTLKLPTTITRTTSTVVQLWD